MSTYILPNSLFDSFGPSNVAEVEHLNPSSLCRYCGVLHRSKVEKEQDNKPCRKVDIFTID